MNKQFKISILISLFFLGMLSLHAQRSNYLVLTMGLGKDRISRSATNQTAPWTLSWRTHNVPSLGKQQILSTGGYLGYVQNTYDLNGETAEVGRVAVGEITTLHVLPIVEEFTGKRPLGGLLDAELSLLLGYEFALTDDAYSWLLFDYARGVHVKPQLAVAFYPLPFLTARLELNSLVAPVALGVGIRI
jgi:hypothetical protein